MRRERCISSMRALAASRDIMLQEGEELVSVSAGDTVRWIVGDTTSASGAAQRVHVLVKPIRPSLKTNLVITTNRRIYLLELTCDAADVDGFGVVELPARSACALKRQAARAEATAPVAQGITLERLRFRYDITGDRPSWRPLRAFDDGERVYIEFPRGIAHGELPPLFVVGVGRHRRARQLSVSRALLHRRSALRRGGASAGW